MAGRHFDEWPIGDHLLHEIRPTLTETYNLFFSAMTHNPQPLRSDRQAKRASIDTVFPRSMTLKPWRPTSRVRGATASPG